MISPTALQTVLDSLIVKGITVATADKAPPTVLTLLNGLKAAIDFPGVCIGLAGVINMIPFIKDLTAPEAVVASFRAAGPPAEPLTDLESGDVPAWFQAT